jgi:large subunit ribosomal protein L25
MSDKLTIVAESRSEFGKGAARRARAAGKIPAVIYGHGTEPVHVVLPAHQTSLALKHVNALLTIKFGDKSELVIARDVQRDAVRRTIDHVDLLIVKKGEKIAVEIPIHVVGEPFPGNIAVQEYMSLHVNAEATSLPEGFEVSVEGLTEGTHITAAQVELPKSAELLTDPEAVLVVVTATRALASDEGAGEAGEADKAEATEESE